MLIITYFLGLVLVIALLSIILSYVLNRIARPVSKPLKQDFAQEAAEEFPGELPSTIDYRWKEPLKSEDQVFHLPETYGNNYLVLMVKNPYWLYAYWEIHPDVLQQLACTYGESWEQSKPVLRTFNCSFCTSNEFRFLFDLEIPFDVKNWHINVPSADCTYCVEIGRKLPDGTFISILRSDPVTTPRSSVSSVLDENWLPCNVHRRTGQYQYGISSSQLLSNSGISSSQLLSNRERMN